jgi:hypothetical protein
MDDQPHLNGRRSMKKFSIILLSLFLSVSTLLSIGCKKPEKPAETSKRAARPEWKHMVTFKKQDFYMDSESVRYDHSIVTFSYMSIGEEGEVDKEECSINCRKGTLLCGERKNLPRNSTDVKSKTNTDLNWSKIKPDSAWFSFQKSLCKEIAPFEARLPETPTQTPSVKKKSKELAQSQSVPAKQTGPGVKKKGKEIAESQAAPAKQTAPGAEKKSIKSGRPEPPPAKSPMAGVERKSKELAQSQSASAKQTAPSEERKSKELVRLESAPPGEPGRKVTERGIYFDRYTEVTGMSPGSAEGLIYTGRESRAWYEKSRVSSPLDDREVRAINDTLAKTEVQNACSIANSIFPDKPEKTITLSDLKEKGFIPSESIKLTIDNGTKESLRISAKHNKGTKLYVADSDCHIREELQH